MIPRQKKPQKNCEEIITNKGMQSGGGLQN